MALEMMQDVLEAKKQVDEMFDGKKKLGGARVAKGHYRDLHAYLDMLSKGEVKPEETQVVAQKAMDALLAYGNAMHELHGKHPAND